MPDSGNTEKRFDALLSAMASGESPSAGKKSSTSAPAECGEGNSPEDDPPDKRGPQSAE